MDDEKDVVKIIIAMERAVLDRWLIIQRRWSITQHLMRMMIPPKRVNIAVA